MSNAHDRYLAALPEDWPRRELGQICTQIVSGGTPPRSNSACWGGSIPWVTPGELTNLGTKYLSSTDERITDLGLASSGATLVPSDSLLVTTRATLGSVALTAMPLATNQGFKTAMFVPDVDASFGYHLFHRLKPELTRRSSGTTFLEISGSQFKQIVVPVPPSPEQRRIAEILDTADDAIRSTKALIEKLSQVMQGLLHDLMTRGVDERGQLRDPLRHPEVFVESELGYHPSTWVIRNFGDLANYLNGYAFKPEDWMDSGRPIIRIQNLNGSTSFNYYNSPVPSHCEISPGSLLFAWSGTRDSSFGPTIWSGPPGLLNQHIFHVYEKVDIVSRGFLYYLLAHNLERIAISAHGFKDSFVHVKRGELTSVKVAVPDTAEQARIVRVVQAYEARWADEARTLHSLGALKQGLSDDLLTGRIRVQVDDGDAA